MADVLKNMQEAKRRRSDETESRPNEETNGHARDSMVKITNKNVAVGYYDKTESIQISQKKGDEDEMQKNSIKSRPEKRAKTNMDSRERSEDLENRSLDAQENVPEQIAERQMREADQDNMKQQQSNDETDANDQQNMDQQKDTKRKQREVRFRLEQFYNRQRTKKQQFPAQQQHQEMKPQQEQEPTQEQQQPLASHFQLYPLLEKLAYAVETGTRDQNSNALVTEVSSHFNKSQQVLNSVSGSLGFNKTKYVDGQKRKLEDSEKLVQQRRELMVEYRKYIEEL